MTPWYGSVCHILFHHYITAQRIPALATRNDNPISAVEASGTRCLGHASGAVLVASYGVVTTTHLI